MITNQFKHISKNEIEDHRRPISYVINGNLCGTMQDFYGTMKKEFSFFKGFGDNWDALYDSLCDLKLRQNCAIYVTNYHNIFSKEENPDECLKIFNEILWDVIEYYKNPESRGTGVDYDDPIVFVTVLIVK
jgi:RNAse (barnase) inhibitor barstar